MNSPSYIEASDPRFTPEGFTFLVVPSPHLGGRGDIIVYVPPAARDMSHLCCVMLLHGVYCSSWSWPFQGGAHQVLDAAVDRGLSPVALVMASDGLAHDGTAYLPSKHADYGSWITDTVVSAVTRTEALPQIDQGSPWCIAGLSMGGYGALRLGALRPDLFGAAAGHSSVVDMNDMASCLHHPLELVVGEALLYELDLNHILTHQPELLPIRMDCGLDDPFIDSNRRLHHTLRDAGITHVYEEYPGGHTYEYWNQHLLATLRFFEAITTPR